MSRIIALGVALAVAFSVTPPRAAEMLPPQVLDLNVDDVWRPGLGNYATEFNFWVWQNLGIVESLNDRAPAILSGGEATVMLNTDEAFSGCCHGNWLVSAAGGE